MGPNPVIHLNPAGDTNPNPNPNAAYNGGNGILRKLVWASGHGTLKRTNPYLGTSEVHFGLPRMFAANRMAGEYADTKLQSMV